MVPPPRRLNGDGYTGKDKNMKKSKKSPIRVRVPVARQPGKIFRARKGRGSYLRQQLKKQLRRDAQEE